MRRGRIFTGTMLILVTALFAIPGAYAADPIDIAADLADGRLDGTYSQAELSAYLQNATLQGYDNPVPPTTTVVTTNQTPPGTTTVVTTSQTPPGTTTVVTPPAGGSAPIVTPVTPVVAGAQSPVVRPAPKPAPAQPQTAAVAGAQSPPLAATQQTGTLPFTGVDLALLVAGGAFMLGLGLVARRLGRN